MPIIVRGQQAPARASWAGLQVGAGWETAEEKKLRKLEKERLKASKRASTQSSNHPPKQRSQESLAARADQNLRNKNLKRRDQLLSDISPISEFQSDHTWVTLATDPLRGLYYVFWKSSRSQLPGDLSRNWNALTIKREEKNAFALTDYDLPGPGDPAEVVRGHGRLENGHIHLKIDGRPWIKMPAKSIQPEYQHQPYDEEDDDLTPEDIERLQSSRDLHAPRFRY